MYQAAPYLYLGKERISHQHHYDDMSDERLESFNELLEIAEDVRNVMVIGAFSHVDSKTNRETDDEDEEDDRYLRSVENQMRRDSTDLLKLWMSMKGGSKSMK